MPSRTSILGVCVGGGGGGGVINIYRTVSKYCTFGIFREILFSRKTLKGIFSTFENSLQKQDIPKGFIFTKLSQK